MIPNKAVASIHTPNDIAEFVKNVISRLLPNGGSIFDPTCGNQNRQFKKYFTGAYQYNYKYSYKGTDLLYNDSDVFKDRASEPTYDIVWYDPPFTSKPTMDKRSEDYGTKGLEGNEVKKFFSVDVIENLASYSKKFIAVRGMDFYFPINSTTYFSFHDMCIKPVLTWTNLEMYCLFIMPYWRHDMDRIIELNRRPVINYSYCVIFTKDGLD